MEMTKEQADKICREKFEELERPIFFDELDEKNYWEIAEKVDRKNLNAIYYKDSSIIVINLSKRDSSNSVYNRKIFYYPFEEKMKIIKLALNDYNDRTSINAQRIYNTIEDYFKKFYDALYNRLPYYQGKDFLNLYRGFVGEEPLTEEEIKKFDVCEGSYNTYNDEKKIY